MAAERAGRVTVLHAGCVSIGFARINEQPAVAFEMRAPSAPEPPEGRSSPWQQAARGAGLDLIALAECERCNGGTAGSLDG